MSSIGSSPFPQWLFCGFMGLMLNATGAAQPPFSGSNASPSPVLYLAQLDDDDLDELEDEVEDLDDEIEDEIADGLAEELEDEVEEQVEDELDDVAEDELEDNLDDEAEDLAEDLAEEAAEDRLDEDDFDELDDDELDELHEDLEQEDHIFDDDDRLADAVEERLLDAVEDDLESLVELNTGDVIVRNEMLVLADETLLAQLNRHPALELREQQALSALGTSLGSFSVRRNVSLESLRAELRQTYPGLSVDFNHGYELNQGADADGQAPITLSALYRPTLSREAHGVIGMLDGPVNAAHPAFSDAQLTQKAFVPRPSEQDRAHGTAVASLLVGRTPEWQGLAPNAELYVASVFSEQARYGSIATTQSLITALDWLVSQSVNVINISLAGPANQTLEAALKRVRDRGILPVAAAGNAGPLADPQYPAAYPMVVAVTALDQRRALYPYAVRGEHLDFSAYGVGVSAAAGEQGFAAVTGTSFAAPSVTALLVRYVAEGLSPEAALRALEADTLDLGEPGKDPLFGHGLAGQTQLSE